MGTMKFTPNNDGIDHINVYSKGKTRLGRMLSNFTTTPFETNEFGNFLSVEGFWYYILTGDDKLRNLTGFIAKRYGQSLLKEGTEDQIPKELLKLAYQAKIEQHENIRQLLLDNKLPLVHYYVFGTKIVAPEEYQWTVDLWNEIKNEIA